MKRPDRTGEPESGLPGAGFRTRPARAPTPASIRESADAAVRGSVRGSVRASVELAAVVAFVVAIGVAMALPGCGGSGAPEDAEAAPAAAPNGGGNGAGTPVRANVIEPGTLADTLEIAGRLEPWAEVQVAAELGGAVGEVRFDKGDRVQAGQVLAMVGADLLQAALAEAEADLAEAEMEMERARALVEREAAPRQRLQTAGTGVERAEARVEAARLRLGRAEIRAPSSGVVTVRAIEPGEVLAPGSPVAVIQEVRRLRAAVGIPETDIAWFSERSPAEISVDAYPNRTFSGTLDYIAPTATSPGRNFLAEIEVANPDGELRSGLLVRARLARRIFEDAVVIERDALVERDGELFAFVLAGGHVVQRRVVTGPDEGSRVVIVSGLQVGETLVEAGHRNLLDGDPVRVVDDSAR